MIVSFASQVTQDIYNGLNTKRARRVSSNLHAKIRRVLDQLNAALSVDVMRAPPGNCLEKLEGKLKGFWSVRVNDQWRIIFRWEKENAYDVEVIDYH